MGIQNSTSRNIFRDLLMIIWGRGEEFLFVHNFHSIISFCIALVSGQTGVGCGIFFLALAVKVVRIILGLSS